MSSVWSRGNGAGDEDLWDDTELIRAYDEAKAQAKDGAQAVSERSEGNEAQPSRLDKRAPEPSAATKTDQPAPKRAKPATAKKPAAVQAPVSGQNALSAESGTANATEADAAAQYAWQAYYAQMQQQPAAWNPQYAVAPSYFAPSVAPPLAPVQDEALQQLLTAWYNAGYQAGRYQALRGAPS